MANTSAALLTELAERLRVPPGSNVTLPRDHDPTDTGGWRHEEGKQHLTVGVELLAEYQDRLAAQDTRGLLVVLQGMDAAGKDSAIRHVMSGVNPQGVVVHSFKEPAREELDHHYLWRCELRVPARGQIGIFNRSYYEEVLIVRVHPELLEPERLPPSAGTGDLWRRRFREIDDWERMLVDNGIHVVKLFLNISREEQRTRFLRRIERPEKNWKFAASDIAERAHWDAYQHAYSEMLRHTSTEAAPWYVIPADHKWFAHIAVGAILVQTLMEIDPQYPTVDGEALERARAALEVEAPEAAAPPSG
jgi:PPK2 family polyphosphate:nucleotide phosphotransferase